VRRRRGLAEPEPPPAAVLDGPLDVLQEYAAEHRLDMVELIKLRANRRKAGEGLAPRYRIGSLRG
jgi:hypothetical protein